LARKLFFDIGNYKVDTFVDELGTTVGEALLATHSSFLPKIGPLLAVIEDADKDVGVPVIKGLAHITGGGFLENIPRILPEGVSVEIDRGSWHEPPIFGLMQRLGNVTDEEMFRTFNMGIGMVVVCSETDKDTISSSIQDCVEIGRIVEGDKEVRIIQ
jgi:phosphoribosylformylglycinamidine cyclo-ligase